MLKEFNVLASTSRGFEKYARRELRFLFERIGDASPEIERSGVSGLIVIKANLNTFEVIRKLRALLIEVPYEFRFTLRVMPIERVVNTDLDMIQQTVTDLSSKIGETETFRITVEKRHTALHSNEIIEKVAMNIKRKVNLSHPDKIVLIEIVGGSTGISIIQPEELLSVQKEKLL